MVKLSHVCIYKASYGNRSILKGKLEKSVIISCLFFYVCAFIFFPVFFGKDFFLSYSILFQTIFAEYKSFWNLSFYFCTWDHHRLYCGVRAVHLFSCLCCPIMCLYVLSSVLWCPLRILLKTMFGSSLPPVACRKAHVLFTLFLLACA